MTPGRILSTINETPSCRRRFHNLAMDARKVVLNELVESGQQIESKFIIKIINRVKRNSTKSVAEN